MYKETSVNAQTAAEHFKIAKISCKANNNNSSRSAIPALLCIDSVRWNHNLILHHQSFPFSRQLTPFCST